MGGIKGQKKPPRTEEHKKNLSKALKGRIVWNKGKKCLQRAWNKGIPCSEETKRKISISTKGRIAPNKGIQMSDEQKRKLSESKKGQVAWNKGLKGVQIPWNKGKEFPQARERLLGKRGNRAIGWKGGRWKTSDGYICVYCPEHPFPNGGSPYHVFEHRLVMEKQIGRFLLSNEAVHHKNGIKNDNRIENLVLTTHGKHMKFHNSQRIVSEETKEKHRLQIRKNGKFAGS